MTNLFVPVEQNHEVWPETALSSALLLRSISLCWNLLPNSFKSSPSFGSFKKSVRENKNLLNSISFEKASCSVSFKSIDFKYF